ncbi:Uncharacterised protein g6129 [Pycnogonum litorale]
MCRLSVLILLTVIVTVKIVHGQDATCTFGGKTYNIGDQIEIPENNAGSCKKVRCASDWNETNPCDSGDCVIFDCSELKEGCRWAKDGCCDEICD